MSKFSLLLLSLTATMAFSKQLNELLLWSVQSFLLDAPICVIYTNEALLPLPLLHLEHPKILQRPLNVEVNYLVIVNETQELVPISKKFAQYDNKRKYLLFIKSEINETTLESCFKLFLNEDIYNLVTITNVGMHTWYPYGETNKIIRVIPANNPFTQKIPKTFHQHPVKLIWTPFELFTTPPTKPSLGYVNRILLLIGKKTNLKMLFSKKEEPMVYAEHLQRIKAANLTKIVLKNKVDVIAFLYGPSIALFIDENLSMSFPVTFHTDYWLLPRKQPLPSILLSFPPATTTKHLLVTLAFFITTITWYLSDFKKTFSSGFFSITAMFLQQPTNAITNNNTTKRILMLFIFLFACQISTLYSSQCYTLLYKPPFPKSYKNIKEILDKTNYRFAYSQYAGAIARNLSETDWRRMEERKIPHVQLSKINRKTIMSDLKDLVLSVSNFDLLHVLNPQDLEILPEKV